MTDPTLLTLYTDVVRETWIDYNRHMSEGYYSVAFGNATDAFMDHVGLHAEYRAQSKCTIYTVETHTSFLRELKVGSPLTFTTQVLGFSIRCFTPMTTIWLPRWRPCCSTSTTTLVPCPCPRRFRTRLKQSIKLINRCRARRRQAEVLD